MANIFDEIIVKGVKTGQIPARTQDARDWYRKTAQKMRKINERELMRSDTDRLTNRPIIGNMYMFYYDPKWKEELPYYDRFPLIFPFQKAAGGFLGLNLHYLPPQSRAKLMDGLYEYANNPRYDETTKIKLNYQMLNQASQLRFFKPCIKHYLSDHVVSKFMYIYPSEWDIALFLDTAKFEKANRSQVYKDSKAIIRG
jgi:hypothetical protein